MSCLSYRSLVLASLPDNSQPPQTNTPRKTSLPRSKNTPPRPKKNQQQPPQRQRPSLLQMERAIGAGSYRDGDTGTDAEVKKTEYDGLLPITTGQFETPIEETLRKTGEWLVLRTSRSPGKGMLLFVLKWILPIWTLSVLVGTGIVKLPFSTPFLDDLFM